jgi:hypothetical protein
MTFQAVKLWEPTFSPELSLEISTFISVMILLLIIAIMYMRGQRNMYDIYREVKAKIAHSWTINLVLL